MNPMIMELINNAQNSYKDECWNSLSAVRFTIYPTENIMLAKVIMVDIYEMWIFTCNTYI